MARLPHFPDNPEQQAHAVEQWALAGNQEAKSYSSVVRFTQVAFKDKRYVLAACGVLTLIWYGLSACTRSISSGVIPTAEASHTLSPSDTPTGTAEHTATNTATLTATPPPATEHLVVPPSATRSTYRRRP